jgi:hypothetical protein
MIRRGTDGRSRIESQGLCFPALYEQQAANQIYQYDNDGKDTRTTNTEAVK